MTTVQPDREAAAGGRSAAGAAARGSGSASAESGDPATLARSAGTARKRAPGAAEPGEDGDGADVNRRGDDATAATTDVPGVTDFTDGGGTGRTEAAGATAAARVPFAERLRFTPPDRLRPHLRWLAQRPVLTTLVTAGVLHILWLLLLANEGGDLAAQDAWAEFAGRHPSTAYNFAWYGGMHPVSYSVVSPYLMAVLGVRTTMMLAGTLSAGVLALILARSRHVRRPLVPSLWGAVALLGNAASGRVTFALGLLFALVAIALVFRGDRDDEEDKHGAAGADGAGAAAGKARRRVGGWRGTAVVLSSMLATAASPVAGMFVGLVAVALFLQKRRVEAYLLGATPPVVVALSSWLFPFQGTQPMPWISAVAPMICCALIWLLTPESWRTVRICAVIYFFGTLAAWIIPSPIGSNIERLALIFAGTVLLVVAQTGARPRAPRVMRSVAAVYLAFGAITVWVVVKPVVDLVLTSPTAAWTRELAPLVDQLRQVDAEAGRVEVVPVRSHREASALQPYVSLARGWNRQADLDRHEIFYDGSLTPKTYHAWLKNWAVRYVVLPVEDRPDTGAHEEAKIVAKGQPYLTEIWADANWRLFRVNDPTPLVEAPAEVRRADEGELVIDVKYAGPVLVRVPFSPWLGLVDEDGEGVEAPEVLEGDGSDEADVDGVREWSESGQLYVNLEGCVTKAGEWTRLHAPRPGTYRISAPYQLPRGTHCPD
ncbi:MFS transporter [Streptomyces sp. WMMC500]|uniref:MFS transporter n=1 Tax=Streptomyces sp. WMMC500 TaxID=3015154 RepID=UPI00248B200E|nr:MFS transporter [Streptomyces sp. WMMC500]WBB58690.1 MFS transporter [Streptomyces sp. WMMC500]